MSPPALRVAVVRGVDRPFGRWRLTPPVAQLVGHRLFLHVVLVGAAPDLRVDGLAVEASAGGGPLVPLGSGSAAGLDHVQHSVLLDLGEHDPAGVRIRLRDLPSGDTVDLVLAPTG